ncbi:hypothetical protein ARMSODRAFT_979380 [Armillaria solidipes]|uniref:Uncharacterized protein n=1 Tax=Armillaria solidipes TaxID=1076256 RepID=A0A2H3AZB5_9AGAR|nr:hypothetical protein ARMSODRAFT_979380 [Armillaria solidipes]
MVMSVLAFLRQAWIICIRLDAYNVCIEFENSTPPDSAALVYAWTLGYLIIHSPAPRSSRPYTHAYETTRSSPNSDRLPSNILSVPILRRAMNPRLREALKSHKEAKVLVSGDRACYSRSVENSPSPGSWVPVCSVRQIRPEHALQPKVSASTDEIGEAGMVYTQCARIALESTYLNEDSSNEELASVLAVLKSFGYAIAGTKFTRLEIWFEKTPTPPYPKQSHPRPGPLRNPHLSLPPEVARLSGAAEYIDKQDRVIEDLGVLAGDGSSAEVLSSALLKSMNQPMRQVPNL